MTSDEALEDHEVISIRAASRELRRHGCWIIDGGVNVEEQMTRIIVTNGVDPAEAIDCTPAAIMAWLGY